MATPILPTNSSGRASGPIYRVSTREISADFLTIGPDQSSKELGVLNETAFRELLGRFAALPAIKLLDGDPQLIVAAKRGRFLVIPSGGALLIRPVGDPMQSSQKFSIEELPTYLHSTDRDPPVAPVTPPPPPAPSVTAPPIPIPSSVSRPPFKPSGPPAPIFGEIPTARDATGPINAEPVAQAPIARPPFDRRLLVSGLILLAVAAGVTAWIWFRPAPPPRAAARPPGEFDVVTSAEQLSSLQKRYVGNYATSGDSGERLLELRSDGTYRYQEFGSGVSRTANRSGSYTFAVHRDSDNLVIRAGALGSIEIVDEKSLLFQRVVFTRLP